MDVRILRLLAASIIGAAALAGAGGALAQSSENSGEPEWRVTELVVVAPAPRLWKLTKGQSTVWVLGSIGLMPKNLKWNTAPVEHAIAGVNEVLLPPEGSVGLIQAVGAIRRSHLPHGEILDEQLSSELRTAYHEALSRLGRDPAKYQHEKPAWAALMLEVDLAHAASLTNAEPESTVKRLARDHRVRTTRIAAYNGGRMLDELVGLSDEQGRAALEVAVHGADFALDHASIAGHAWAAGQLKEVRANLSPDSAPSGLLWRTEKFKALEARAVDDTVSVVSAALSRPGSTFAILPLSLLARRDGALDRLRQQGVTVAEPQE